MKIWVLTSQAQMKKNMGRAKEEKLGNGIIRSIENSSEIFNLIRKQMEGPGPRNA